MSANECRKLRVRALIEAVIPHLDALPTTQRADVYEGIAEVTLGIDNNMHEAARAVAEKLRKADLLQLRFRNLFEDQLSTEH